MTTEEMRRFISAVIEGTCKDWECPGWFGESGPPSPVTLARLLHARLDASVARLDRAVA